jgi:uncharacterized membrane protein YhiD involved in acid resistance
VSDLIISIFMAAGFALSIGAVILLRRGNGRRAALMALAALLMFGNAAIWLVPTDSGASLANPQGERVE